MIRWAKDILYDLWVEESGSDQGNELLRSWKVKGNLVWDRVWGPGRGGGSFLRSKRGKEEAAFNRAQKGQDGEQGDKQNRRRSLFEEQKRKRLSERTRGTRVQASKGRRRKDEGSGKGSRRRLLWSHLQREQQGGDLTTKIWNRYFWADHAQW